MFHRKHHGQLQSTLCAHCSESSALPLMLLISTAAAATNTMQPLTDYKVYSVSKCEKPLQSSSCQVVLPSPINFACVMCALWSYLRMFSCKVWTATTFSSALGFFNTSSVSYLILVHSLSLSLLSGD